MALDVRDVTGASYVKNGKTEWTPVVLRRKQAKLRKKPPICSVNSDSDSNLSLTGYEAEYLKLCGTPGVAYRKSTGGAKLWTPIAARTRIKLKANQNNT